MTRSSRSRTVAEWMQQQIRDGIWPLNSQIPTETELAEKLGVGRSTIREATRSMANTGMLESAAGRGTFVRSRSPVNAVLTEHLLHQPFQHVLGLRRALEVEVAGLAAAHRTDADLDRLRRSLEAGGGAVDLSPEACAVDPPSPGSFHADVFDAARNPLLTEFYQCAVVAVRRAVSRGDLTPGTTQARHADHERIFEAIAAGDVEAAREAAGTHADRDFVVTHAAMPIS